MSEIEILLQNALSSDSNLSYKSNQELVALSKGDLFSFLTKLGVILSNEEKPLNIRQFSAIAIKNSLTYDSDIISTWKQKLTTEQKSEIKLLVLSSLASKEKQIRSGVSSAIAAICKIEAPLTKNWSDLIPSLSQNVFNDDLNIKLSAIETLGYVCEELTVKTIDGTTVNQILDSLIRSLQAKGDSVVIQQTLKALFHVIKLAEHNFANENEMKIILSTIFSIANSYSTDDNVLEKIAMLFIEMFSSLSTMYDYVNSVMNDIIEFAFALINTKSTTNERLALLGLEILCSIGDEEVTRAPTGKIIIKPSSAGLFVEENKKIQRKYFNNIVEKLKGIIFNHVTPLDEDDEAEWNLSKGCLYLLSIMVRVVDFENVRDFLGLLVKEIGNSKDKDEPRAKCWLLLASSLDSSNKNGIVDIVSSKLKMIYQDIDKPNLPLKRSASYLLMKISEKFPKEFGEGKKIEAYINPLLAAIISNRNSSIEVHLYKIVQNIIKAFGDLQTNKSCNTISDSFENIFKTLFIPDGELVTAVSSYTNILERLMTMNILLQYTSHDKQETLVEILVHLLKQIEFIANEKNEQVFRFEDYYYILFRTIFGKYKKPIGAPIAAGFLTLTQNIFNARGGCFEEANLAFGALANNMKKEFTPIFNEYYKYLDVSIRSNNDSSLSKSGLIALLSSIRSIDEDISKESDNILKMLVAVCTDPNASRTNKTVAITCIGEIAMVINENFEKYLSDVMNLLFSACQMSLMFSEASDYEEDDVEFAKELQFEIVQTFTCISFAMEQKKKALVPYIPSLLSFFNSVLGNNLTIRVDTLKSILSLIIDFINFYGKEMKAILNVEFTNELTKRLRSFNIPSYSDDLSQYEHILNLLFNN